MKRCSKCGHEKPLEDFQMNLGKRRADCKECHKVAQRQSRERRDAGLIPMHIAREKRCTKCGVTKPIDAFHFSGHGYRRPECIECGSEPNKLACNARYHAQHPDAPYCNMPFADPTTGAMFKKCGQCGVTQPLTGFNKAGQGQLVRPVCRICQQMNARAAYQADPEYYRSRALQYHHEHKERRNQYHRKYYSEHRAERRAYNAEYSLHRRIVQNEYAARRRATPEGRSKNIKYCRIRWDRLRQASIGQEPFTRAEIIERDGSICYICGQVCAGRLLHLDHVIPLAKGGLHNRENVRVCCRDCNSKKRARILQHSDAPFLPA